MSHQQNDDADMTSSANEAAAAAPISADARTWGMISHLSAFVVFLGIPTIVGPLVAWLVKKDADPYIDFHGKEALNFNLSFLMYGVVSAVLILTLVGILLVPVVALTWFVLVIVASVNANNGEYYRYPLTIRFIR